MAGKAATLRVNIVANARQARQELKETQKGFGRLASGVKNHAAAIAAGVGAVTAAAIGAARAAAEEESAQIRLATALRNNAGATREQIAATEEWIDAVKYGSIQSDDTLRPALARLVTTTGDVTTAQKLLAVSMDVAAGTGKSLDAVTVAVAKAYGGSTTALGRLIPGLDTSTISSGNLASITGTLSKRFGGADKAASDSASGGLQDFSDATGDAYEAIGEKLLPVVRDFTDWATSKDGKEAIESTADAFAAIAGAVEDIVSFTSDLGDFIAKVKELNEQWDPTRWATGYEFRPPSWWPGWLPSGRGAMPAGATGRATPGISPAAYGIAPASSVVRTSSPAPVVVNVSGALDPVAVAAQIRRILSDDARRRGIR